MRFTTPVLATLLISIIVAAPALAAGGASGNYSQRVERYLTCAPKATKTVKKSGTTSGSSSSGLLVWQARPGLTPLRVPTKPILYGPEEGTILDGTTGRTMPARGQRSDLVFDFRAGAHAKPPLGSSPGGRFPSLDPPIGDTTHYRICAYRDGVGGHCDDPQIPDTAADIRRYTVPCTGDTTFTPPNGGLALQPSRQDALLTVKWKMQACRGSRCSAWSGERSLFWLPPPTLASPNPDARWSGWPAPGHVLRANRVEGVTTYLFCLSWLTGRCSEWNTVDSGRSINSNKSPWVVEMEPPAGDNPGIRLYESVDVEGAPEQQTAWYADPQRYGMAWGINDYRWTAAACFRRHAGETFRCVYQPEERVVYVPNP